MKSLLIFALGLRCRLPPKHLKSGWFQRMGSGWFIIAALILLTLACNQGAQTITITRLPEITRTPLPTLTPTPPAHPTLVPAVGEVSSEVVAVIEGTGTRPGSSAAVPDSPTPSLSPATPPAMIASTTSTSPDSSIDTPGWTLNGAQLYPSLYTDGLLLYGQVTNNTGSAQALSLVTATFLDAQGQLLAASDNVVGFYWPVDIVPVGGTVPFELTVEGIQNAAAFKLIVEAEPAGAAPRQDFEFIDLSQRAEDGDYCLGGGVRNLGGDLKDYLAVAAVVYDDQNRVISFSDYYEPYPEEIKADQTLEFELCIDLEGQNAAHHELLAWGE